MNQDSLVQSLIKITNKNNVLKNENMSRHTTFKVGGEADIFVTPDTKEEAAEIVRLLLAANYPYMVIGNGSNLLVSDKGYRGCIICMADGMNEITVSGNNLACGAGVLLSKLCSVALENSLEGLVFASGIPGSVGGAVYMNAGAYGGEIKDVIKQVELFDAKKGEFVILTCDEMNFGYRTSIVRDSSYIVTSAEFVLRKGNAEVIRNEMLKLSKKRRDKQPLEYPSAGSTFKRPEGYFAGKLIEDAGLRGYGIGGASVSEKHCGFVINKGNATCEDIIALIRYIRQQVNDKFGVVLEPEVCILGEGVSL